MNTKREGQHDGDACPWPEGAHYRYHCGGHELVLSHHGVTPRLVAEIEQGEVELALVVEGPWIVLGYRFGESAPWSCTSPFNWHMMLEDDRVVPDEAGLTPGSYSRLWSTLWISLVDPESGRILARRAVALGPEFTIALQDAIRSQAREPFSGAVADHALSWLNHEAGGPIGRAVARVRCGPAFGPKAGRPAQRAPLEGTPGLSPPQGAGRLHSVGSS